MGILQRIERKLEGAVDDGFARVFGGKVAPQEVENALQREAEYSIENLGDGGRLVPNSYTVVVSSTDHDQMASEYELNRKTFSKHLEHFIRDNGWQTYGDVVVEFEHSPALHTGQFRARGAVDPDARPRSLGQPPQAAPPHGDPNANREPGAAPMTHDSGHDPRRGYDQGDREYGRAYDQGGYDQGQHGNEGYAQNAGFGDDDRGYRGYEGRGYGQGGYHEADRGHRAGYGQDFDQGGYDQGAYRAGGGYQQGSYGQSGGYDQGGYDQGPRGYEGDRGYQQAEPGYYTDSDYRDAGYGQGGYDQGGYGAQGGGYQGGYDQPGYEQGTYRSAAYDHGYGQVAAVPTYAPTGVVLCLEDGSNRTFSLRDGSNVIGRGQDAQFRLPDTGVSRRHVEVRWDGQTALLHDLNSTNGTTVNDVAVSSWELADGDRIRLGHSDITVRFQ